MPTLLAPPATDPAVIDTASIDLATRREFLAALAAAGLLAGCGTPPAPDTAGPATRTVIDLEGRTVEIPTDPQRVVSLDANRITVDLVTLGIVPVGAMTNPSNPGAGFAPTLGPEADGIESVGVAGEVDLERVASLRPDLIFWRSDYGDVLDQLTAVAPTISFQIPPGLLGGLRWLAELLGRTEQLTAAEDGLRAVFADNRDVIALAGSRVGVVSRSGALYLEGSLTPGDTTTEFVRLLGASIAPIGIDESQLGEFREISPELLGTALADAEFVIALRFNDSIDDLIASPVWQAIPAVAAGEVAYLDGQQASGSIGLPGIRLAVEDLAAQRAGRPS